MAWASRSERDRQALNDYVEGFSTVLSAWQSVPGLAVSIDKTRVEAAMEKRERQLSAEDDEPQAEAAPETLDEGSDEDE